MVTRYGDTFLREVFLNLFLLQLWQSRASLYSFSWNSSKILSNVFLSPNVRPSVTLLRATFVMSILDLEVPPVDVGLHTVSCRGTPTTLTQDITISNPRVPSRTTATHGFMCFLLLAELWDVDTPIDWISYTSFTYLDFGLTKLVLLYKGLEHLPSSSSQLAGAVSARVSHSSS